MRDGQVNLGNLRARCASKGFALILLLLAPSVLRAESIPVLIIDGNGAAGREKGGDAFHVDAVFKAIKGYAPAVKDANELEKEELRKYPLVFLLNVPKLSDKARANLEEHVKAGAGVAFFVGDKVQPAYYNRQLHRKGEGIFPVQLANRPTDAPDEKQKAKEKGERPKASSATIILRNSGHPVCADLHEVAAFLSFVEIERYYPVARSKRDKAAGPLEELITLPNEGELDAFKEGAQKLNRAIPVADDQYKDFRPGLERHQWAIRQTLIFGKKAHELGDALDNLLEDRGDPKDAEKPDLTALWRKPELKELRQKLAALRDKTRYGDPLVVAAPFGKGRVIVCFTSAGKSWNDWADGPAAPTFVILTANMASYLRDAKPQAAKDSNP
jgi:hypothetical protein